ncbi:hypothetical protein [Kiloniella antarctica]|uniref:LexA repressor DNA-binding domain-containing protein n=1 Tax=Kiloniella antarctica TaxID=1550907 RepID=A0ABW5BL38_9PROT
MTDKINLRTAEYNIFRVIAKNPERKMPYRALVSASGYAPKSFSNHLHYLVTSGVVTKSGPLQKQTIHAVLFMTDVQVGPVTRRPSVAHNNSKPKAAPIKKKRNCLKCREKFWIEHKNNWICKGCKSSVAWTECAGAA